MYRWLQQLFAGKAPSSDGATAPLSSTVPAVSMASNPASAQAPAGTPQPAAELAFEQRDQVDTAYQRWLFDSDSAGLDTSDAENAVLDATGAILNSQQSGAALVRRLPGLIPQLLQSLRSDTFSAAQMSRLISTDVVLVAAVIRVANGLYIGTGTTITSVEHAVILIGQEGLRQLITSVAFRPIFDMNSGHYTRTLAPRIWEQSERCALAGRMLAEARGMDPFEAFLAGLVQNVGLIVTLRLMDGAAKDAGALGSEVFTARLIQDARALSCSIGREWNFPEAVVTAIAEQGGVRKGVSVSPLGRVLTLGDYLSKMRLLMEAGRIKDAEPALLRGLPDAALSCYQSLDSIGAERSPI